MRVLVATTAGAGHFGPLVPFARTLVGAGHEVRVAAPASFRSSVESTGLVHEPVDEPDPAALGAVFGRLFGLPLEEGDQHVVQDVFGRLNARAALPGMRREFRGGRPHLLVPAPGLIASYVPGNEAGGFSGRVKITPDGQ